MKYTYVPLGLALFLVHLSSFAQTELPHIEDAGPALRLEYELTRTVDPSTGELPPAIKQREYDFAAGLPFHRPGLAFKGNRPLGFDWKPAGPWNQSGRIRALAIDIENEKNLLVGSASGGVWRSIDRGESWVKVTPVSEIQTISSIVQDTRVGKRSTWYYGTSELLSTTDRRHTTNIRTHSYGNGIYRSLDNGATWSPLSSTQTRNGNIAPKQFEGVWNIALDHRSPEDIIYAACQGGIMRSTDGGSSWKLVLGSDTTMCFNSDIVIGTNGTLYAAISSTLYGVISPSEGVWTSQNGTDWEKIFTLNRARRIKLAVAPSDDSVMYLLAEYPQHWESPDSLFTSTAYLLSYDHGKWGQKHNFSGSSYSSTLGGYAMAITVHPTNPDTVFYAGVNLYRSLNAGQNSSSMGVPHSDIHALVIDPHKANRLYMVGDGGVYSNSSPLTSSAGWATHTKGLETSQIYDVKINTQAGGNNLILCGLQDNFSHVTHDGNDWETASGGDGMTCAVINGSAVFVTSWQFGNLSFYGYKGNTIDSYGRSRPGGFDEEFTFFTRYLIEPYSKDALFLPKANDLFRLDGLQAIAETENAPDNWLKYTNVGNTIGAGNIITSLAASNATNYMLYLGSSSGAIYRIEDPGNRGSQPEDISSPSFPEGAYPAHIEVDPDNELHIIVAFSNYNVQSIFRTTDGGMVWEPISGNLEEYADGSGAGPSLRSVRILHTAGGTSYFAATSSGLFSTDKIDGMNTVWVREGATTIGNLLVESIDVRPSDGWIVCATQGGGLFTNAGIDASVFNKHTTPTLVVEQNYPNPVRTTSDIRFHLQKISNVIVELFDVLGKSITTLTDRVYPAGDHSLPLSRALQNGNYFYRFTAGNDVVTKMFTVAR